MSREAAEDGRPDVAAEIGPAAMTSEGMESGEACMTDEAWEPLKSEWGPQPDEGDKASAGDKASPGDDGGAAGPADHDAGGLGDLDRLDDLADIDDLSDIDVLDDLGELGEGDKDDHDEEVPGVLIEMAEPVELGEPGPVLSPPRQWPRLLLALGFVLLAAVIVGGAIVIVGSVTHGFKKPVKVTYTKSPVFSLRTGECLDPQGQTYTLISCDSPHVAEVFATFNLAGTSWPGSAKVAAAASSGCAGRLTGYLNPQLAVSLASTYVYPDATAWQAGTRTVICEVRAASGQLTGSVRGASATAG
jgi:hypothetical protein